MPFPGKPLDKEWDYKGPVDSLSKGINLSVSSDSLDDQEVIRGINVLSQKGRLRTDTGYIPFGSEILGVPQADFQFSKSNGVTELLLVTTEAFYKYNTTEEQWQFVSDGTATTASGGESAGATSVTVASISGFSNGNLVGIILNDGTEHQTTVNGVPAAGEIPITDAIPVGKSVANGAAVIKGTALDGDLDNHVIGVTVPSHDWFAFTNGSDRVKRYDGTDCITVPGLPNSGNVICKSLALYNNSLFLVHTIEGGTAYPRRVRRSNSSDPTDWTTGIAGYDDLYEDEDNLMGCELLGPYLIIYAEREIIRGEFIGTGGVNYNFVTMVRGEGVFSSVGVADIGDAHCVFAQSNTYLYRGGFELEPVGDKIYNKIYGANGELSPGARQRAFTFYVEELDEVWFFYPSTSAENCDRLLRYNVGEQTWLERVFNDEFVGFGFYQRQVSRTWNSLVGNWLSQVWKWNDRTLLASAATTHLMPATGSQVMEYDYVATLDNGADIPYTVETKDFTAPDVVDRFDMLEVGMRGTDVLVEYSTDEGGSWEQLGTMNRTRYGRARVFLQFVFEKVRFRFTGVGSDFVLGWYGFSYKEESVYEGED